MGYIGNQITTVFPTSISVDSATISGNTTVGGTLGVTGATTLSNTLGVTGATTLSDNIVFDASSKGVHLGVTSATASNLLDDYEEGSHTVTFTNVSFNPASQGAVYTKIGNVVNYVGSITFPSSSDNNNINISIPFNSASKNGIGVFLSNGVNDKILFTGGDNTDFMRIYPDNSFSQNSYANLSGLTIYFTITYQTNA